jgi:hypothetical protein
MRRLGPSLTVAATCALLLVASSPTPAAAAGGGFGIRPANPDPADPSTRAYFKREVPPGRSFSDQVLVTNLGFQPLQLSVTPLTV